MQKGARRGTEWKVKRVRWNRKTGEWVNGKLKALPNKYHIGGEGGSRNGEYFCVYGRG